MSHELIRPLLTTDVDQEPGTLWASRCSCGWSMGGFRESEEQAINEWARHAAAEGEGRD